MYDKIRRWIHRKIYKLLIFKTVVLDKNSLIHYDRLETFCELVIDTDKGPFKFQFKHDRRNKLRNNEVIPSINNYVIELVIPDGIVPIENTIKNKLVIVVKVILFKPDYDILTELLYDTYLDMILDYVSSRGFSVQH